MTVVRLALALLLLSSPAAAAPADTTDVAGRLDTYLSRLAGLGFSGSALVARGDTILVEAGYGLADREAGRPWSGDTPSTIGSITKPFTATAVTTLLEAGRLSVDDPLPRFFDAVPADKAAITVGHLLTHSAGFPGAIGPDSDPVERDPFVRLALETPLLFEPGARYEYSNVGYSLLGAIVEIVTGEGYEAYLRRAVLEPAGMSRSGYRLPDGLADSVAVGYRGGERWGTLAERPSATDGPGWHLRANGGLLSTVGDLWRFDRALDAGRIVAPAWRDSMETRRVPEDPGGRSWYGWGWAIFETPGGDLVAHNGGNGIFAADLRRYEDGLVVAALSNVAGRPAIDVTPHLVRIARGDTVPMPPAVVAVDPDRAAARVGTWRLEGGGEVHVEPDGDGGLVARPADGAALTALGGGADSSEREARALAAVRAADAGDYAPLAELFGGAIPLEEVQEQESGMRRRMESRLGPRTDVRLIGTALLDGRQTTIVELVHEGGSRYVGFRWVGESVGGVSVDEEMPGWALHPASETEWFAFDSRSGVGLTVRFGDDGAVFEPAGGNAARAEGPR